MLCGMMVQHQKFLMSEQEIGDAEAAENNEITLTEIPCSFEYATNCLARRSDDG